MVAASVPFLAAPATVGPDAAAQAAVADARQTSIVVVSSADRAPQLRNELESQARHDEADRWVRAAPTAPTTTIVSVPPPAAPAVVAQTAKIAPPPQPAMAEPRNAPPAKARPMPFVVAALGADVPAKIRQYEPFIQKYAREHNVDPRFVAAVIMTESSGDRDAVSPKNAVGLMQVLDGPSDPEANIDEGTKILARWLKYYGSVDLALAAYNAGPGNVNKYGGVPPFPETHKHIARTLSSYRTYQSAAA